MRRTEQILLATMVLAGVIVGFWLLILSPKRDEASKLDGQLSQLRSSLGQARQQVAEGEQARQSFGTDYRRLVVLGKAVPADDEQSSLLIQLQNLATRSEVQFQGIDLSGSSDSSAALSTASSTSTDSSTSSDASSSSDSSSSTSSDTSATTPASATEAAVSMLPIGATVGSAGLPVMSYDLTFTGEFFQIADLMRRVDSMVHTDGSATDVDGRLLTVNGFDLQPAGDYGSLTNPVLNAHLNVTTYVTPDDQGLTDGATPSGPSAAAPTLGSSSSSPTDTTTAASTTP
jgi:Type II secretion system (T2SS), protein M